MQLNYKAPPTVARFLQSNAEIRVIMGPQGSGKSSGSCIETLRRSMAQTPDPDGIRRSKWVIVRNTMPMLKDTTIPTFLDWFPSGTLGTWHLTDKEYKFKFNDVEASVLFRALDDKDDVAKLLSAEYTGCYFNEFREIDPSIFEAMTRRVGRYPSLKNGPGPSWWGIWCDTNPPQINSWHHLMMEKQIENNWDVYKQPGGRSPLAENLAYLRRGYYDPTGLSPEYVRVMIDGEYGHDLSGLPVFGFTFRREFHISQLPLRAFRTDAGVLWIGLDAGLTPAAVIGQQDVRSRLNILGNVFTPKGQTMGMDRFMSEKLMPYLRSQFPGFAYRGVIDPAAAQRGQANELTPIDVVKRYFPCYAASTNKLDRRVNATEVWLGRQVDGTAALLFDPTLTFLNDGMAWGYRYERKKDGTDKESIEKNTYSHSVEALGYLCVHMLGASGVEQAARKREVRVASAVGWT